MLRSCFIKRTLSPLYCFLLIIFFSCTPYLSQTLINQTGKYIDTIAEGDLSHIEGIDARKLTPQQKNDIISFFSSIDKKNVNVSIKNEEFAVISYHLTNQNTGKIINFNLKKVNKIWIIEGNFEITTSIKIDKIEKK